VVELLAAGHEPVIVDSLVNAKPTVIDRVEDITGYRVPLHRFDIRDEAPLEDLLASDRFEAVLHFAGLKAVGESVVRPLAYYDANVSGSVTLLEAMERHGIRTIVFSSSATVYGDPLTIPVTEAMPTGSPTNPYGWTKLMIEQILRDVHAGGEGWSVALLRYFNPVGAHPSGVIGEDPEGLPNNLMPYISQVAVERLPELRLFGNDYPTRDGTGVRDYIHVVDLARGHVSALNRLQSDPGLHVWNLGTGNGVTVLELVAAFERASGVKVPYRVEGRRPGDIAAIWADPTSANVELGWSANLTVDDMCRDTWRWQQYAEGITKND
jgi:UDP-glucose 4-epimerase